MSTLKKICDKVTTDCVQGYIKNTFTNEYVNINFPVYIAYIIMCFYGSDHFDQHEKLLKLNLCKNTIEYFYYDPSKYTINHGVSCCRSIIWNSVWCCRSITNKQPYLYSWTIKILDIGSLKMYYWKRYFKIKISNKKFQKNYEHDFVELYYEHDFESTHTCQSEKDYIFQSNSITQKQLNTNDEIKINFNVPAREIEFLQNNCTISILNSVQLYDDEKYNLIVSMADPNMKIQLVESIREKIQIIA